MPVLRNASSALQSALEQSHSASPISAANATSSSSTLPAHHLQQHCPPHSGRSATAATASLPLQLSSQQRDGGRPPRAPDSGCPSPSTASCSLHVRTVSSPSASTCSTPQPYTRSLLSGAQRESLISVSTLRPYSAASSPVSAPCSPCHTPPRLFSPSRRSSLASSSGATLPGRSQVLGSQELLFAIFDCLDFTQLFSIQRVCRRWHARLGGDVAAATADPLPSSYSMDFRPSIDPQAERGGRGDGAGGKGQHRKRRSLVTRLMAKFACSVPTSPTDDGQSTDHHVRSARARDDSGLQLPGRGSSPASASASALAVAVSLRNSSKHFHYFLRRSTAHLTSLPTTAPARKRLLRKLRHVRHLHFSRRAERRLDGEWVAGLIDALGQAKEKLLSLSLCGCSEAADFGVGCPHPPLLSPTFLSAQAISHAKRKPVAISDSSFALLFCPSSSASCFPSLTSLSLANCYHLGESSFLLLSSFPCLRALNLSGCIQLSDDTVEAVVRHNAQLSSLRLSGCRSLTNATPYYLSSFLASSLTHLDLSGLGLINDAGLAHLATLHLLTHLSLRALEFITDKGVVSLSTCIGLTQLDLSDCPFVSNKALAFLSLYLHLTSLNLAGCTLLNDRGVHYVASTRHERRRSKERTAVKATAQPGRSGGGPAAEEAKLREAEERAMGLVPAVDLVDIVGLDVDLEGEEEDDSSWMVPTRAPSAAVSPSATPRLTAQRAPGRMPPALSSPPTSLQGLSASGASPLRQLCLARCANLTDQAVRQLATYSPLVTSLDLSGCSQLTDGSVLLIATSMTQLMTLSVASCSRLTDIALLSLSSLHLHRLILDSLTSVTEDGVAYLCQPRALATSLRSLSLNNLPKLTDSAVRSVSTTFTGLQGLAISHCPLLSDQSAFHISIFLPSISEVAFAGCEGLSDEGFTRLLRLRAVDKVDVSHCRRLTAAALTKLFKHSQAPEDKAREAKAAKAREKKKRKEREAMVRRGEVHAEDLEDEEEADPPAEMGAGELSDSLQLLVVRGCSRISEQVIEDARNAYRGLKIVH